MQDHDVGKNEGPAVAGGAEPDHQGARTDRPSGHQSHDFQDFIFYRELSEIYLLLDHISGRWDKELIADSLLEDLTIADMDEPPVSDQGGAATSASFKRCATKSRLKAEIQWIEEICEIGWPNNSKSGPVRARQAAVLLVAKDRLNAAARPASGMTIAFTLMVTGDEPQAGKRRSVDGHAGENRQGHPLSRTYLARAAFPGLVSVSHNFSRKVMAIMIGLCLVLLLTCCVSWSMASGYAILARLDALQLKRDDMMQTITAVEMRPPVNKLAAVATSPSLVPAAMQEPLLRYCDRPKSLALQRSLGDSTLERFHDAEEIHLCDRLTELESQFANSRMSLSDWLRMWRWTNVAYQERVDAWSAKSRTNFNEQVQGAVATDLASKTLLKDSGEYEVRTRTDEEWARVFIPLLLNSVLPFFYGIIGAGTSVVRHLRMKTKESLLSPRDINLAMSQIVLGATIGACVGLFVAQSASPGAGSGGVVSVAGLTGSALSFIAGFGVEGVFAALESLVRRVFNLQDPAQKS